LILDIGLLRSGGGRRASSGPQGGDGAGRYGDFFPVVNDRFFIVGRKDRWAGGNPEPGRGGEGVDVEIDGTEDKGGNLHPRKRTDRHLSHLSQRRRR